MKKIVLFVTLVLLIFGLNVPKIEADGPTTHNVCREQAYSIVYSHDFGHGERPIKVGIIVTGPTDASGNPQYDILNLPPGWYSASGNYKEETVYWNISNSMSMPFTIAYTLEVTGTNLMPRQETTAGLYVWYPNKAIGAAWGEVWTYKYCVYLPIILR